MNVFLDTNVFLYAFLNQDVAKKVVAASLVAQSVKERTGHVSMQVVKEFCNVMVKKSGKSSAEIGKAVALFGLFKMVAGSLHLVQRALQVRETYNIQFYDSLLVASAEQAGCDVLYTEDLNDGQMYGIVKAVNPFKPQ